MLHSPVVVADPDMTRLRLQCRQVLSVQPSEKALAVAVVEIVPFRFDCRVHAIVPPVFA
jgi:hypothetical protein